jgi:hypothetical protein
MGYKLKRDAAGNVVAVGEKPVVVDDNGKETEFDVDGTIAAVKERNAQIVTMREELKPLKEQLAAFEGLDPKSARTALEVVAKLDQKQLIDAGQVDKAVQDLKAEHEKVLTKVRGELDSVKTQFKSTQIGAAFANSEFLKSKVESTPVPLIQSYFKEHFSLDETGNIVALDSTGKQMYSTSNPAIPAGFDEAIERLIGESPFRDRIITTGQSSGTNTPSNASSKGTGRITRKQFEALPASEKPNAALTLQIVD